MGFTDEWMDGIGWDGRWDGEDRYHVAGLAAI